MKSNYYIIRLTLFTLLRILLKGKKKIGFITFINSTKGSKLIIQLFYKMNLYSNVFIEIPYRDSVAGPILNLSEVRNDKAEVISLDIYHHILKIRKNILNVLLRDFNNITFIKKRKELNYIAGFLGLKIAEEIKDIVYLANYAKWKYYNLYDYKNVLIIPNKVFSKALKKELHGIVDKIILNSNKINNTIVYLKLFKGIILSIFSIVKNFNKFKKYKEEKNIKSDAEKINKIMVYYAMGLKEEKRNDIPFIKHSNISLSSLLIYCKFGNLLPDKEEHLWMNENEIKCFFSPGIKKKNDGREKTNKSSKMNIILNEHYLLYLRTFLEFKFKKIDCSLWMLKIIWNLGHDYSYWKNFFIQNNVKILINSIPSATNFLPNLVLSELGGILVEFERSIRFDYTTYIHNLPNSVYFATGNYSIDQVPESYFSKFVIKSGGINVSKSFKTETNTIRKSFKKKVAIFDETSNDVFTGKAVEDFYLTVLEIIKKSKNISFLIKTKKPFVLEKLPKIRKEIQKMEQNGVLRFADWRTSISEAASSVDLVITLPSTAAFESILSGTKTIVYNPMKCGSKIFYKNYGLNKRIFENSSLMVVKILDYLNNKDDSIGCFEDIINDIDPFLDGIGYKRIGEYINKCYTLLNQGNTVEYVLKTANESYKQSWGADKIIKNTGIYIPLK